VPKIGGFNLTAEQYKNAQIIMSTGRKMGASKRDIQIAIMTAMTESSLRNVNYGDKAGPDSRGLFQQRNGWGPISVRMDPAGAAGLFYKELFKVKNRDKLQLWQAAQKVQRSAFSDGSNYRKYVTLAQGMGGGAATPEDTHYEGEVTQPMALSAADLADQYGFALTFLKSNKELWNLFNTAINGDGKNDPGQWTSTKFIAKLKTTKWWQTNSESVRQYQLMKANDPAKLAANRAGLAAQIQDSASGLGAMLSKNQLNRITENALMFGWNEAQIRNTLSQYIKHKNGVFSGQAADDVQALHQLAWRNGLNFHGKTFDNWTTSMAAGNTNLAFYQAYIRDQAKALAPSFARELDAGKDLYDIANPYIQAKARILQVDPESIDLFDPDVRGALSSKDKDGKPTSKSLWQFEQEMRNKPEYLKTDEARNNAYSIGHQVLKDFGFMGN
jgi:hypothetical protein